MNAVQLLTMLKRLDRRSMFPPSAAAAIIALTFFVSQLALNDLSRRQRQTELALQDAADRLGAYQQMNADRAQVLEEAASIQKLIDTIPGSTLLASVTNNLPLPVRLSRVVIEREPTGLNVRVAGWADDRLTIDRFSDDLRMDGLCIDPPAVNRSDNQFELSASVKAVPVSASLAQASSEERP